MRSSPAAKPTWPAAWRGALTPIPRRRWPASSDKRTKKAPPARGGASNRCFRRRRGRRFELGEREDGVTHRRSRQAREQLETFAECAGERAEERYEHR